MKNEKKKIQDSIQAQYITLYFFEIVRVDPQERGNPRDVRERGNYTLRLIIQTGH